MAGSMVVVEGDLISKCYQYTKFRPGISNSTLQQALCIKTQDCILGYFQAELSKLGAWSSLKHSFVEQVGAASQIAKPGWISKNVGRTLYERRSAQDDDFVVRRETEFFCIL
jgi:hypothetical protein